jgi:hypothetical protein
MRPGFATAAFPSALRISPLDQPFDQRFDQLLASALEIRF